MSETAYRLGEWDLAITQAESALELTWDLDHERILPLLHAAVAAPHAARGRFAIADEHAQAAVRIAEQIGDFQALLWARTAAGRVAHSRNDPAGVIAALEPLRQQMRHRFAGEPGLAPWQHLYANAQIRQGSYTSAAEVLDVVGQLAATQDLPIAELSITGEQALLQVASGHNDAAVKILDGVETLPERCRSQPFELACFNFLAGSVRLSVGQPDQAIDQLRRALKAFRTLRATPWVDRATAELRHRSVAAFAGDRWPRSRLGPFHIYAHITVSRVAISKVGTGDSHSAALPSLVTGSGRCRLHPLPIGPLCRDDGHRSGMDTGSGR